MDVIDRNYVERYYSAIGRGDLSYLVAHFNRFNGNLDRIVEQGIDLDGSELHQAVQHGHLHLIKWLVEVGGLPINNDHAANNEVPLHFIDMTPEHKVEDIVAYMLKRGADYTLLDDEGKTPFQTFIERRGLRFNCDIGRFTLQQWDEAFNRVRAVREAVVAMFLGRGAEVSDIPWVRKVERKVLRAQDACRRATVTWLCVSRCHQESVLPYEVVVLPYEVVVLIAKEVYRSRCEYELWKDTPGCQLKKHKK